MSAAPALNFPVCTTDRAWLDMRFDAEVRQIR